MLRQLEAWAAHGHPLETCGLLIGRSRGDAVHVSAVRLCRNTNVERARDRFDLDPVDHLACEDEARALGLEVVGVWHSHPDAPATPSELDRARAWRGWSYVIAAIDAKGTREVRAWRLRDGELAEQMLEVDERLA